MSTSALTVICDTLLQTCATVEDCQSALDAVDQHERALRMEQLHLTQRLAEVERVRRDVRAQLRSVCPHAEKRRTDDTYACVIKVSCATCSRPFPDERVPHCIYVPAWIWCRNRDIDDRKICATHAEKKCSGCGTQAFSECDGGVPFCRGPCMQSYHAKRNCAHGP